MPVFFLSSETMFVSSLAGPLALEAVRGVELAVGPLLPAVVDVVVQQFVPVLDQHMLELAKTNTHTHTRLRRLVLLRRAVYDFACWSPWGVTRLSGGHA